MGVHVMLLTPSSCTPFRCVPFRRGQAKGLKEAQRLLEAGGEMDGTGKAGDMVDARDPDMLF